MPVRLVVEMYDTKLLKKYLTMRVKKFVRHSSKKFQLRARTGREAK
jgi:hypothetical protein